MELISGVELFEAITNANKKRFDEKKAKAYMRELFLAVSHLHAQDIIHRDIKPQNIMVDKHDRLRLIDFGLAEVIEKSKKDVNIAGTPMYMSPEAYEGRISKASDMWALGVLLYQIVSGYYPFNGTSREDLMDDI